QALLCEGQRSRVLGRRGALDFWVHCSAERTFRRRSDMQRISEDSRQVACAKALPAEMHAANPCRSQLVVRRNERTSTRVRFALSRSDPSSRLSSPRRSRRGHELESLPTTIADVVKIRALATPDALAILAPGRSPLAFGALARAIDATIQSLARAGYGRGDRVALALAEGPEMAVAVLSVSGCATCMPLNPALDEASYRVALSTLRADAVIVAGEDSPAARAAAALSVPVPVIRLAFSPADPAGVFTLEAGMSRP